MMTLTEYNTIKPKFSITEKKEQYIQTIINNLKLIKVLRKELKISKKKTIYAIHVTNTTATGSCAITKLWHKK